MAGRDPRTARVLGLWTAAWLAAFLIGGLLWLGDLSLQWPVLGIPLLWALVSLRPRGVRSAVNRPDDAYDDGYDDEDDWHPVPPPDRSAWHRPDPGRRTDTVERPAFGDPYRDDRY